MDGAFRAAFRPPDNNNRCRDALDLDFGAELRCEMNTAPAKSIKQSNSINESLILNPVRTIWLLQESLGPMYSSAVDMLFLFSLEQTKNSLFGDTKYTLQRSLLFDAMSLAVALNALA